MIIIIGIQENDKLISFGNINSTSTSTSSDALKAIAKLVSEKVNSSIPIIIIRNDNIINLNITPKAWGNYYYYVYYYYYYYCYYYYH